eukprot:14578902-Alexandrium_andersonii.AAC.1
MPGSRVLGTLVLGKLCFDRGHRGLARASGSSFTSASCRVLSIAVALSCARIPRPALLGMDGGR